MEETRLGLRVETSLPFEAALERVTDALKSEGFGVITSIDMQQTLKAKLGKDFRKYTILGACNPPLVDRALAAELEVGLLLPCNVIVYQADTGGSVVSAIAPESAMSAVSDNPALRTVAAEAGARLRRALANVETSS